MFGKKHNETGNVCMACQCPCEMHKEHQHGDNKCEQCGHEHKDDGSCDCGCK